MVSAIAVLVQLAPPANTMLAILRDRGVFAMRCWWTELPPLGASGDKRLSMHRRLFSYYVCTRGRKRVVDMKRKENVGLNRRNDGVTDGPERVE